MSPQLRLRKTNCDQEHKNWQYIRHIRLRQLGLFPLHPPIQHAVHPSPAVRAADLIASRIPPGEVVESRGVDDMMPSYTSIQ